MRIGLLGGLTVEHDGRSIAVSGSMQLAVLFRLAIDAGTAVSYRAIAEDVWGMDAPENERAALQSIVSRLRLQLPSGLIESTAGGYRLAVARADVDALAFADLVAVAGAAEAGAARGLASQALALWAGEPWVPSEAFDWFERDMHRDRATAIDLGGMAASVASSTIPAPLTGLVGREHELESVRDQLAMSRLVTVIGTGGAGKTRLAVEAASIVRAAVLVEFAPVGPQELYAAVLAATGRELRTVDAAAEVVGSRERVLEALAARQVLLVLDNCEHVIAEAAALAQDLLGALPQLRILATSREPLSIPGEAFVTMGPLAHPTEADLADNVDPLAFAAVELFRQRALAATGTELDAAGLRVAARICARLDGLPLALELAAAKLRTMSPDEVLDGLDDRFTLLTGGFRAALPRHQTLRAMIDWSWSMLSGHERTALAHLAVFPAGVSAGDAKLVAAAMGLPGASVFDSLVDRSLLQRSRGRYRALETIREYGIEKLAETGDAAAAREAQVNYLAARASDLDGLLRGPHIHEAITWFDAEDDNIAAALRYATQTGMAEQAIRLATACAWYWTIRDRSDDARTWFIAVAPMAASVDTEEARVIALLAPIAEAFANGSEMWFGAEDILSNPMQSLSSARELAVGPGGNELLQVLPVLLQAFAEAGAGAGWMLRANAPSGEKLGLDPWPTAVLHAVAAVMAQNRGDVEQLGAESELALEHFEKIGDLWGLALAQQLRAEWLVLAGRLDEAFRCTEDSTANMRKITSSWDLAQQQSLAISILMRQGRIDDARTRVTELLAEAEDAGNARTLLQVQVTAMTFDAFTGDIVAGRAHLARYDELVEAWPGMPIQMHAWAESAKASFALLDGDDAGAENHLRRAVDAALISHDHPVIGMVALSIGSLALSRGDLHEALRAVELSTAILGAHDTTSPQVAAIEAAAAQAGIERAGTEVPTRSAAVESLRQLLPPR
ncbi:MAG: hypothetical protein JWO10_134 [Microbacteriaceae bacterium]|nr:hypothetical protein [Microbacteriaceae bacterium]